MATLSGMLRSFTGSLAGLLIAFALFAVVPATVVAQGPGDDQYADPFGDLPDENGQSPPPEQPEPPPPSDESEGTGDPPVSTPSQTEPADTVASAPDSSSTATSGTGEELARTGLPAGLPLLSGLALLSAGVLLRLRVARR